MKTDKKNRFILEFIILWGIWILIMMALTDMLEHPERFVVRALISFVGFFIITQINFHYLFPKFFLQKKQGLYFLLSILLIGATVLFIHLDFFPWSAWFREPPIPINEVVIRESAEGRVRWFREIVHMLIAMLGSTLIGITRFANKKSQETVLLKNEKLETELKFLKSQVNPHFLFNALNNIYSLAVMQAAQTPDSVMQLSEILRYMVYDSNEASVPLKSEINYIQNFVDLKLLKDSRGMNVEIELDKSAPDLMIAPLLFVPFVENAFKHSKIESLKDGFIKINLSVKDRQINFNCVNNKPEGTFTKDEVGGVGLVNTKKRLALLYPDNQHHLTINDTDDIFEVILKIKLS